MSFRRNFIFIDKHFLYPGKKKKKKKEIPKQNSSKRNKALKTLEIHTFHLDKQFSLGAQCFNKILVLFLMA